MNAVYLDSSALVKRYVHEPGSPALHRLFREGAQLLVSPIAWAECLATLARKRHDGSLAARSHEKVCEAFASEWSSLHEIALTGEIRSRIRDLVLALPLRGMDAIHLASALWAAKRLGVEIVLWSSDRRLLEAALALDLESHDPEG
jgi:predicted nucleic acid-binding protein